MSNKNKVSDSDTRDTAKRPYEGERHFIYIGPSLSGGRLQKNTVLQGTYSEITAYFQSIINEFPQVAKLLVPVGKLREIGAKAETSGNLLNKNYQEVAAAITATTKGVKE